MPMLNHLPTKNKDLTEEKKEDLLLIPTPSIAVVNALLNYSKSLKIESLKKYKIAISLN